MTTPVSAVAGALAATPTAATPTASSNAATGTAPGTTGGTTGAASLLDPQAFLQLLVAQLKYQDPTNPTDTSTFMNQTAMLSQVQTMGTMSSTLSALAEAQQAQSATAMIGKQVTYLDGSGLRVTGVVTSASLGATGATLQVGGTSVPLSGVLEVAQPDPPTDPA